MVRRRRDAGLKPFKKMNRARDRRLKATGKWFQKTTKYNKVWYNNIFPILLLVSLFFLIYNQ